MSMIVSTYDLGKLNLLALTVSVIMVVVMIMIVVMSVIVSMPVIVSMIVIAFMSWHTVSMSTINYLQPIKLTLSAIPEP